MPTFQADALASICTRIFQGAGSRQDEAQLISRHLVNANLMGHDSHGVLRIPQYLAMVKQGYLVPGAPLEVVQEAAAIAVLNAHWGYGQVAGRDAMEIAVDKASTQSLSSVVIHQCNHLGRLSDYLHIATSHDMIGVITVNGHGMSGMVAPYGGAEGRMMTNPIAVGIPTGRDQPILLDMATSVVAEGKVRSRYHQGEPIPMGWLVDHKGILTTDPTALYTAPAGALLPMGGFEAGHKGYGLAFVIEILSGALSQAGCAKPNGSRPANGVFMLVLNIAAFTPVASFKQEVDAFCQYVKSARPMEGFGEVLLPGEPGEHQKQRRSAAGITIDPETWRQIAAAAVEFGVTID